MGKATGGNTVSTNKQALREAAEKATPGPWRAFRYDSGVCGVSGGESFEILVCERISSNRPEDAKFIASANPATVLALLDELAAANVETEKSNLLVDDLRRERNFLQDLAGKRQIELEAAEKRIAELESRTVVIPDDLDFDCEFENGEYGIADEPWLRGRVDGFNTGMKEITKAIRAAGITVKGE
ncbi:ead/Ea22-like family protein [Lelliottia wanjuensis]|uniref:ead/Ea22-like family protein n=1 Tax=Lelliottia wanjuensis TaxID=3050585 RepID=UPI00254CBB3F|nr:ead/Ea22-like family protein [Lelliottia sp. V86_10]MDK9585444.1 ead/Ea22-like family protein [Lelliottia sp. V86_10]